MKRKIFFGIFLFFIFLSFSVSSWAQGSLCSSISDITSKIYFSFVIHNEEDDINGVPNSTPFIPDYNGNEAVFNHFADAMMDFAQMLSSYGASLSFQPDWTFIEGVENYRPDFFMDLLALGTVEIIPHAHETYVPYDGVYDMLVQNNAQPKKILGGMTRDKYISNQAWFDTNPGYAFWKVPLDTAGHVDDKPPPALVYRIFEPRDVSGYNDLYIHIPSSPIIVTPGVPPVTAIMFTFKPAGNYITPSHDIYITRRFLAESGDMSVPSKWRKNLSAPTGFSNNTAAEIISTVSGKIENDLLPLVQAGQLEFKTVGEIIDLYQQYESCLDLADGQDLCEFVPSTNGYYESARISGATPVYYPALQAAYDISVNNDTIQSRSRVFQEDFIVDRNITVSLEGGYGCDYSTNNGQSIVNGEIIISNGKLIIESGTINVL